jgi:hypothetical protein
MEGKPDADHLLPLLRAERGCGSTQEAGAEYLMTVLRVVAGGMGGLLAGNLPWVALSLR